MKTSKGQRRVIKNKKVQELDPVLSPEERSFQAILQGERTVETNSEGYHFVRPRWHRWVYGSGKQSEKD